MTETVVTVQPTNGMHAAHTQQAPGQGLAWLQFNLQYFATIPGIIKLVQLVRRKFKVLGTVGVVLRKVSRKWVVCRVVCEVCVLQQVYA